DVLMFFAACYRLGELRAFKTPQYPLFNNFGVGRAPTLDWLKQTISMTYMDSDFPVNDQIGRKGRNKEADRFADFVLEQWPTNPKPSIGNFEASVLNIQRAIESIVPEWQ